MKVQFCESVTLVQEAGPALEKWDRIIVMLAAVVLQPEEVRDSGIIIPERHLLLDQVARAWHYN